MKNSMLSIIIPMYNGAQTIRACLDSILYQRDSEKYEIIVVNDGSNDLSASIVTQYHEKHPNIILINQPNAGVSTARNNGIEYASGKYITFVDCDDMVGVKYSAIEPYTTNAKCAHKTCGAMHVSRLAMDNKDIQIPELETDYFVRMLDVAEKTNAEVAFAGKFTVNYKENSLKQHVYHKQTTFGTTPDEKHAALMDANNRENANFALYRRDFLQQHNLRFVPKMPLDEDMLFCTLATLYAKNVATVPQSTYLYMRNCNSASCFTNRKREAIAYTLAGLQRFPVILSQLKQYPQYAKSYTWFLQDFARQGARINPYRHPLLQQMQMAYPTSICADCKSQTCNKCIYLPIIEDKIANNLAEFAPARYPER